MSRNVVPPEGFVVRKGPAGLLLATERLLGPLVAAGLHDPEAWRVLCGGKAARTPGRGGAGRARLGDGTRLVVKQMRRGGLAGRFWRDRFPGAERLLDNLRAPLEAAKREIPTAAPLALLVVPGTGLLRRGWLAVEEIEDAKDLATLFRTGFPPSELELHAVVSLVHRMHDAGLEHRDLNLGNLLVRAGRGGKPEAFVIDLDRARLRDRPLPFRLRQRSLRRLERSAAKLALECGLVEAATPWHRLYAAGDPRLARRLARGRAVGRILLALHRAGWRRPRR